MSSGLDAVAMATAAPWHVSPEHQEQDDAGRVHDYQRNYGEKRYVYNGFELEYVDRIRSWTRSTSEPENHRRSKWTLVSLEPIR